MTIFEMGHAAFSAVGSMPVSAIWGLMSGGVIIANIAMRRRNPSAEVYA